MRVVKTLFFNYKFILLKTNKFKQVSITKYINLNKINLLNKTLNL